jgi:nicotinamidase-related amidase
MDVILIVDMQVGLLSGAPKYELACVIARINLLTAMVRARSGKVVWIRHRGRGDQFDPQNPGWSFLPELDRHPADIVVQKNLNDPFVGTDLQATLAKMAPDRVFIAGWATDFCVDATVRSAVSNNHNVVVVSDAHTVSDRPHLGASTVIRHYNWVWNNLITNRTIRVEPTAQILQQETHKP